MGNCVFSGFTPVDDEETKIKVITPTGGIMELYSPITVQCLTNEFPGHGIFPNLSTSLPLLHNVQLHVGQVYYLLPLSPKLPPSRQGHVRSSSDTVSSSSSTSSSSLFLTPYRMSFETHGMLKRSESEQSGSFGRFFSNYQSGRVWKVKLVISPEQLSEILSQEASTEALIESVRTVAKCGNSNVVSSVANSDQCWKAFGV